MEKTLLECSNKYNILYKVHGIKSGKNDFKENSDRQYEKIIKILVALRDKMQKYHLFGLQFLIIILQRSMMMKK
jgi:hypothetical protein